MAVIGANAGGFTKKQVIISASFFMYCVTNIITPQTFLGREAPEYHTGLQFIMILCFASWTSMRLENRRRDKKADTDPAYTTGDENLDILSGLRDETDRQNKHFRYSG
ncbi:hypothetical protein N7456_002776 [Penicillium angulare]|uniref:Uncharacterized protein n=1 Tax=Penicillium angulare TaxID=116970 RepID=A0A9W9FTC7_9EURO|nr:hypothetical protein N7456_002776 [Penicillium angulare]